jgi:hypothetical protein
VTGREVLGKIAGDGVVEALYARGFVCVPADPTDEMVRAAWAEALAENARGVWASMIEVSQVKTT